MHVTAPEGVSTCRSKNAKGDWVEKVYDCVKVCSTLKGRISDMKVIVDFESRPHKAVTFVVERGKDRQDWNEAKIAEGATWLEWRKTTRKKSRKRKEGKKEKEKAKEANKGSAKTR